MPDTNKLDQTSTGLVNNSPDPLLENDAGLPLNDVYKPKTSFKGDVLRLVPGTGIAQVISLLAAPILTRYYAPEAFGMAAMFASITGILGVLACMRYELSIVLPDNDRDAANLLGVCLCITCLITTLTIPIVWLFGQQAAQWVGMPQLAPFLWLAPVTVLLHGVYTAFNYWNTRTKHFTRLSISRVTSQAATTSTTLSAGFAGYASGGTMIAANVGGQAVATTVLGGQILRDNGNFLINNITWREMWAGLKRHKKFPKYSSWSALFNTTSWKLPVLMLGIFFSPAVVGFYALGFRILQMPMSLIGGAISQVFIQRAAQAKIDGTLGPLVEKLFERLVMVGMFPMLMLTIIGRDLYIVVFGENWAEAGAYTQILSVWAFVWFISSPMGSLFYVLNKHESLLRIQFFIFSTRLFSLLIGGIMADVFIGLFLFSLSGIFIYGFLVLSIIAQSGLKIKLAFCQLLYYFCLLLPSLALISITKLFDFGTTTVLAIAVLILALHCVLSIFNIYK